MSLIGQISDIRVQNLQGNAAAPSERAPTLGNSRRAVPAPSPPRSAAGLGGGWGCGWIRDPGLDTRAQAQGCRPGPDSQWPRGWGARVCVCVPHFQ
jgi:hypothetical protein